MGEDLIENEIYIAKLFGSDLQGNDLYKLEPLKQIDNATFVKVTPEFKRGDILKSTITPELTVIFEKMTSVTAFDSIYNNEEKSNYCWSLKFFRHATKEEKQEFFDELKAEGKQWNAEKLIVEDILKKGDLAIFWNNGDEDVATIRLYDEKGREYHYDSYGIVWENAIKFESKEQFEKILRGEI